MGDFLSPKRRDVVDRLRKRIENYRRHHFGRAGGYEHNNYNGLGEHYRQDNLLPVLHQRWRESRAKKTTKAPKANKDTCSQNEHRNLIVTQKLKKKIDSALPDQQGVGGGSISADNIFNFDEQDSPQPPTGNSLERERKIPRLSVQIVQKINQQQEHSQTIQTNVTVSSTLKHYSEDSSQPGNNSTATSIHTSVECKQEPIEEPQCRLYQQNQSNQQPPSQVGAQAPDSNKSNNSDHLGFDDQNLDELSDILNNLDKVEGELPPDIIKELDKFHEICVKVQRNSEGNESGNMYSPLNSTSPGLGKGSFSETMPPRGPLNPVYEGSQNVNNVANPITNMHGPPSAPIADSAGPAASTLKQMAAQHQQNTPYGMKSTTMDPFADPLSENFSRRPDYPSYSQNYMSQGQTSSFPYSQQNQSFQHMQTKPDMAALTYVGTKPLTHFSDPSNQGSTTPSSLQQLQNQVRTQFNQSPNPQMQITQTQQMQVSHGQQRVHLSQTQQLQMQPAPQQISMSQQQSFNMQGHINQQPPNTMMNEQMNMQLMEKMRQDQTRQQQQQQQQQQRQQQLQQERQQQMRQRQGQMMEAQQQNQIASQYMNRPPPEYKMQQGQTATFTQNGGSLNPLQTMQNMVDQTGGYGVVKSEVPTPQSQNGSSMIQMSAIQQTMSTAVSGNPQTTQGTRAGYIMQHMQRPPSYPPSGMPSQGQGQPPIRPQQQPSTYTSAILRNQRPPNVNVGPDGLNISQPRSHEWPRPMMQPGGNRPPMTTQTSITQQSAAMMQQYSQYPNSTQSMAPGVMHLQRPEMSTMSNQNSMIPSGSTVMMQQQSMQMSQHGVMRPSQPGSYNMANSTQMPSVNSAQGGYPPSSTQDDFMTFLDNAQNSNSDIFDSLGQNSGTPDFNLLDEILGK